MPYWLFGRPSSSDKSKSSGTTTSTTIIDAGQAQRRDRKSGRAPPDVVTYRYGADMVYVQPAPTYEEAIRIAREVFPDLRPSPSTSAANENDIEFSVAARITGAKTSPVRISPAVWAAVTSSLARFEVIEVVRVPRPMRAPSDSLGHFGDGGGSSYERERGLETAAGSISDAASSSRTVVDADIDTASGPGSGSMVSLEDLTKLGVPDVRPLSVSSRSGTTTPEN